MSGQVTLSGQVVAAPASVTDSPFPSGSTTIPIGLNPPTKGYNVDSGRNTMLVNSPSDFQSLGGLGEDGPVTKAHTVYFRSVQPFVVQETTVNPAGGEPLVVAMPVNGLHVREFPAGSELTLFEVKGSGQIEYYFAGNS